MILETAIITWQQPAVEILVHISGIYANIYISCHLIWRELQDLDQIIDEMLAFISFFKLQITLVFCCSICFSVKRRKTSKTTKYLIKYYETMRLWDHVLNKNLLKERPLWMRLKLLDLLCCNGTKCCGKECLYPTCRFNCCFAVRTTSEYYNNVCNLIFHRALSYNTAVTAA